jgi:hypothetical protein
MLNTDRKEDLANGSLPIERLYEDLKVSDLRRRENFSSPNSYIVENSLRRVLESDASNQDDSQSDDGHYHGEVDDFAQQVNALED